MHCYDVSSDTFKQIDDPRVHAYATFDALEPPFHCSVKLRTFHAHGNDYVLFRIGRKRMLHVFKQTELDCRRVGAAISALKFADMRALYKRARRRFRSGRAITADPALRYVRQELHRDGAFASVVLPDKPPVDILCNLIGMAQRTLHRVHDHINLLSKDVRVNLPQQDLRTWLHTVSFCSANSPVPNSGLHRLCTRITGIVHTDGQACCDHAMLLNFLTHSLEHGQRFAHIQAAPDLASGRTCVLLWFQVKSTKISAMLGSASPSC